MPGWPDELPLAARSRCFSPLSVSSPLHAYLPSRTIKNMSVAAIFASLTLEERRFMLAPAGAVEPRLTPAALAAAAVWTTRETGSVETLEALCPGGAYMVAPGELPGDACNVDMSHLVRL